MGLTDRQQSVQLSFVVCPSVFNVLSKYLLSVVGTNGQLVYYIIRYIPEYFEKTLLNVFFLSISP